MDLIGLLALSVLLVPLVGFAADGPLRVALGLAFVIFFPGYSLVAALFPRKGDIGGIERLALSFGLSIAAVPLIGVVINFSPWGLSLYPILISLLLFIAVMTTIAWFRRRKLPSEVRYEPALRSSLASLFCWWTERNRWDKLLSILLIISIIGVIGTITYTVAKPKASERFTEFYILGLERKAENYPRLSAPGEQVKVVVGIVNHENDMITYRLEVRNGQIILAKVDDIGLNSDMKWEDEVEFSLNTGQGMQKVDFLLYREGDLPYRSLHLWIEIR